jgi:hypothetical protein
MAAADVQAAVDATRRLADSDTGGRNVGRVRKSVRSEWHKMRRKVAEGFRPMGEEHRSGKGK